MTALTTEFIPNHLENFHAPEQPKRYCHQALDTSSQQIRLVKLPPHRDGPPQLHIESFELENAPEFIALS
ncbi:hypothetical protein PtrSN002B_006031 [Pyrenophora tritici-repentis]|uniref:Uncharacterized protein n=1 Tax=Pyrenophora tritici-repentis TaxID=45151 RepID=A0A2W1GKU9_9PLEO|nr:hypothetical protein PtrV1_01579 [Pyrenophora tritici-repentis]KAF7454314.1 hypothetical protein A1F99_015720 [Pyrenophora tritici-repentis]KAF7577418.1 hypothetical protein PtrM4_016580 [Pyrenophora tritici-repentis]KAG9388061.1 hypothetical protein A1F94_000953 [Pyrenophora tritici-repentis]KAI0576782.1 hypothetical protein Alg215_07291 [Pyrenophora tritici-repentis]